MSRKQNSKVLEKGNIYFFYLPKVEHQEAHALKDTQRFELVLSPADTDRYRLVTIGRKRLPEIRKGHERTWGFVNRVEKRPQPITSELKAEHYDTKTRGRRVRPSGRPAGEGVYAIVRHGDHTHLAYALELPKKPGKVQRELKIDEEGSFIISIKNPTKKVAPECGASRAGEGRLPP